MDFTNIIAAICVVGGTGLLFGLILAVAAHIFAVKKDERAERFWNSSPAPTAAPAAMPAARLMPKQWQRATRP